MGQKFIWLFGVCCVAQRVRSVILLSKVHAIITTPTLKKFVKLIMDVKEPAVSYSNKKYTIEEYLEMEEASQERHEYYQGEIFAMSGPKVAHGIISGNTFGILFNKLKGKSCRPFNGEQRIHIEKNTLFTYRDIFVVW
jgi:Uma2 family endonuclease